jgi:hypothetical protein
MKAVRREARRPNSGVAFWPCGSAPGGTLVSDVSANARHAAISPAIPRNSADHACGTAVADPPDPVVWALDPPHARVTLIVAFATKAG